MRRRASNALLRSRASIISNRFNVHHPRNGSGGSRDSTIGSTPGTGQTTPPVIR